MNIRLNKRYAEWIAEQVSTGRYASELEAVEEAIAAKMAVDEAEHFRDRRRQAEDDIREGRTVAADDAFFERKRRLVADKQA